MQPTDFMQRAIDLCQQKMDAGEGGYCASLVVKDGEVIGEGWNDVINNSDPTGHCEIHALRRAGKKLGTWDLSGCELYTTWEPCQMCAGAIWWARIDRVYYANLLSDAERLGMEIGDLHREVSAPTHERSRPYERMMGDEAFNVLKLWFDATKPEVI
jgi:guanine deaminase